VQKPVFFRIGNISMRKWRNILLLKNLIILKANACGTILFHNGPTFFLLQSFAFSRGRSLSWFSGLGFCQGRRDNSIYSIENILSIGLLRAKSGAGNLKLALFVDAVGQLCEEQRFLLRRE
jgi:hypothetical protein